MLRYHTGLGSGRRLHDEAMKRLAFLAVAATLGLASPAAAHPVPFTYLDVRVQAAALDITLVAHVFDLGHDLKVEPPERLLDAGVLSSQADAITTLVKSRLQLTANGATLSDGEWSAPEALPDRQSILLRARFSTTAVPGMVGVTTVMFPYDPAHQTFVNFYERERHRDTGHSRSRAHAGRILRELSTGNLGGRSGVRARPGRATSSPVLSI